MRVNTLEDLERADTIYTGGWMFGVFAIHELKKIVEDKETIFFHYKITYHHLKLNKIGHTEGEITLEKEDVLQSHEIFYTTKEEVISLYKGLAELRYENHQKKIEKYPELIDFYNEILNKEVN